VDAKESQERESTACPSGKSSGKDQSRGRNTTFRQGGKNATVEGEQGVHQKKGSSDVHESEKETISRYKKTLLKQRGDTPEVHILDQP